MVQVQYNEFIPTFFHVGKKNIIKLLRVRVAQSV